MGQNWSLGWHILIVDCIITSARNAALYYGYKKLKIRQLLFIIDLYKFDQKDWE